MTKEQELFEEINSTVLSNMRKERLTTKAKAALEEARESTWIPVEKRLPNDEQICLAYDGANKWFCKLIPEMKRVSQMAIMPFCKASVSGSGFSAFRSPKK